MHETGSDGSRRGKRGGIRTIYFHHGGLEAIYMVFVYRGDSTSADVGAEFFLNSHAEAY